MDNNKCRMSLSQGVVFRTPADPKFQDHILPLYINKTARSQLVTCEPVYFPQSPIPCNSCYNVTGR